MQPEKNDDQPRVRPPMGYSRTWQCGCGATLTIRAHVDRVDGPSNFFVQLDPSASHPPFGHSLLPSGRLTWEGLREERGWERVSDQVTCPACVQGRSLEEQRRISRFQPERVGVEIAARHITGQSGGTIQAEAVFARLDPKTR